MKQLLVGMVLGALCATVGSGVAQIYPGYGSGDQAYQQHQRQEREASQRERSNNIQQRRNGILQNKPC